MNTRKLWYFLPIVSTCIINVSKYIFWYEKSTLLNIESLWFKVFFNLYCYLHVVNKDCLMRKPVIVENKFIITNLT